jgi:hypothetical protein
MPPPRRARAGAALRRAALESGRRAHRRPAPPCGCRGGSCTSHHSSFALSPGAAFAPARSRPTRARMPATEPPRRPPLQASAAAGVGEQLASKRRKLPLSAGDSRNSRTASAGCVFSAPSIALRASSRRPACDEDGRPPPLCSGSSSSSSRPGRWRHDGDGCPAARVYSGDSNRATAALNSFGSHPSTIGFTDRAPDHIRDERRQKSGSPMARRSAGMDSGSRARTSARPLGREFFRG